METQEHEQQEQQQEPLKPLLSVSDVIEVLQVGRTTVNSYLWSGRLRSVKIGRRRLVRPEDLDQFIREHQYRPGEE